MSEELVAIYVSGADRLILKGANLIRAGAEIKVSQSNYWKVDIGVGMPNPARVDYLPGGYNGAKTDLLVNSSNSLTGLQPLDQPIPTGTIVTARITKVGEPPPLAGTSIVLTVGWANSA